jgi:hypothetical protein
LDCDLASRVQPLLIVIGWDTAHMLARSDRLDTMPLHKIAKRKMPAAFGECPLSRKADVTADIAFRQRMTQNRNTRRDA